MFTWYNKCITMNTSATGADPEELMMFTKTFQAYIRQLNPFCVHLQRFASKFSNKALDYPNRTVTFSVTVQTQ